MDWVGRGDVIVLALMFLCVIIIFGVGLHRYYLAQRHTRTFIRDAAIALHSGQLNEVVTIAERNSYSPVAEMAIACIAGSDSTKFDVVELTGVASRAFWRGQRNLTVRFIIGLRTLKSIADTAPFFGLAGACLVVLNAFYRGVGMETHAATVLITSELASALLPTTIGLSVAILAAYSHNYLQQRKEILQSGTFEKALEMFTQLIAHSGWHSAVAQFVIVPKWRDGERGRLFQFAQSLPLKRQFSEMPSYAVLVAPGLALLVSVLMAFLSFDAPVGLSVRLLKPGEGADERQFVPAVTIRSADRGSNRQSGLYVNATETSWKELGRLVKANSEAIRNLSPTSKQTATSHGERLRTLLRSCRSNCVNDHRKRRIRSRWPSTRRSLISCWPITKSRKTSSARTAY
jgi:biopolymer transport protein ExbB/TolQ